MTSVEMGSCGSKLKQNQQGGEKKKKETQGLIAQGSNSSERVLQACDLNLALQGWCFFPELLQVLSCIAAIEIHMNLTSL